MIFVSEIVGILFLLVMIYLSYVEYKRKRLNITSFLFWIVIWIGGILLILLHDTIETILPLISIIRVLDLYMILAFMFLFAVIFYLFKTVKNTERRVEELVRQIAIKPLKK